MTVQYGASEADVAAAWGEAYRSRSIRKEYAAFIYAAHAGGAGSPLSYYAGRTFAGMGEHGILRANVVIPFLYLYLVQSVAERLKRKARIAAFIHTHPKPAAGFTCSCHSREDIFLLKLPRVPAVYVVPYENNDLLRVPATPVN